MSDSIESNAVSDGEVSAVSSATSVVPAVPISKPPLIKDSIARGALSDDPANTDTLGFEPYVQAVGEFLLSDRTKAPLTISIEGPWGAGKSSFLKQLKDYLEHQKLKKRSACRVVEFNPWRHEKDDQVWAAFALAFLEKIRGDSGFIVRTWRGLRLSQKRYNWNDGWSELVKWFCKLSIISWGCVSVLAFLYVKGPAGIVNGHGWNAGEFFSTVKNAIPQAGALGLAGALIAVIYREKALLGSTLTTDLKKFVSQPDYESKIPFIEHFRKDFAEVIDAYVPKGRKVIVFLDDLDRCDVPTAANLMQAINPLVGSETRLMFVLGLDREKVAAGIAVKYEKVFPYLRESAGARDGHAVARVGRLYGHRFLEKFIQIVVRVPEPTEEGLAKFLLGLSGELSKPNAPKSAAVPSAISDYARQILDNFDSDSDQIHLIVRNVADFLDRNPRRIKQFLNTFRLYAYICSLTGLTDDLKDSFRLTLRQLGKFVALAMKYPEIVLELERDHEFLNRLEAACLDPGTQTAEPGKAVDVAIGSWANMTDVRVLLCKVSHPDPGKDCDSFKTADVGSLLSALPRVQRPGNQQALNQRVNSSPREPNNGAKFWDGLPNDEKPSWARV